MKGGVVEGREEKEAVWRSKGRNNLLREGEEEGGRGMGRGRRGKEGRDGED